jgi:hypothetical protein
MSHVDDTAVRAGRAAASAVVRPSIGRCGAELLRGAPAGENGEKSDTRDGWRGPRLGDRARAAMRVKHLSVRTEEAYLGWMRRYYEFHGRRDPAKLGAAELSAFLSSLATERKVAASTQNQALAALLFLYAPSSGRSSPGLTTWCAPAGPSDSPSSSPATRSVRCSRAWTGSPG